MSAELLELDSDEEYHKKLILKNEEIDSLFRNEEFLSSRSLLTLKYFYIAGNFKSFFYLVEVYALIVIAILYDLTNSVEWTDPLSEHCDGHLGSLSKMDYSHQGDLFQRCINIKGFSLPDNVDYDFENDLFTNNHNLTNAHAYCYCNYRNAIFDCDNCMSSQGLYNTGYIFMAGIVLTLIFIVYCNTSFRVFHLAIAFELYIVSLAGVFFYYSVVRTGPYQYILELFNLLILNVIISGAVLLFYSPMVYFFQKFLKKKKTALMASLDQEAQKKLNLSINKYKHRASLLAALSPKATEVTELGNTAASIEVIPSSNVAATIEELPSSNDETESMNAPDL